LETSFSVREKVRSVEQSTQFNQDGSGDHPRAPQSCISRPSIIVTKSSSNRRVERFAPVTKTQHPIVGNAWQEAGTSAKPLIRQGFGALLAPLRELEYFIARIAMAIWAERYLHSAELGRAGVLSLFAGLHARFTSRIIRA
jgi:hypothetical protein